MVTPTTAFQCVLSEAHLGRSTAELDMRYNTQGMTMASVPR